MSLKEFFLKLFSKQEEVPVLPSPQLEPQDEDTVAPIKGKLKLGLIVGHTKMQKGSKMAEPFSRYEYDYNEEVAKAAKKYSEKYPNMEVEVIYRDHVGIHGAYVWAEQLGCDAVIELHFNAFNGKEQGTLTLCTADVSDVEFAHTIHKGLCALFARDGDSRGIRAISRNSRGANVHLFPNGVNCLVEPFFGDNKDDASKGVLLMDKYAEVLIDSVYLWGKKVDLLK